nr:guanine nucleotide-binding protein subunit gamma 3 [Tanacetum cinerariifolium]
MKLSRVALQQQQLLYNGKEMKSNETLSGLGVADGDLVMMVSNAFSAPPHLAVKRSILSQDHSDIDDDLDCLRSDSSEEIRIQIEDYVDRRNTSALCIVRRKGIEKVTKRGVECLMGGSSGCSPRPKSPPELYGKRRELAKVVMLEREIGFLKEELKSIEKLQPASFCVKEVADYLAAVVPAPHPNVVPAPHLNVVLARYQSVVVVLASHDALHV